MSTNLAYTLDELERAFPAVPLALHGDLAGKTWRDLPGDVLDSHRDLLDDLSDDTICSLAPALLAAALRDLLGRPPKSVARRYDAFALVSDTTFARLTRGKYRRAPDAFDRAVVALAPAQRHAIAICLAAIEMELAEPCGWDDKNDLVCDVRDALDSYWRSFVTDDDRARLRRQMNEPGPALARALRALDEAFPSRPLDRGGRSVPAGYLSTELLETNQRGKTWKDLDPPFLRFHHDLLPFLDADAIADYLPAFLSGVLREQLDRGPDLGMVTGSTLAELTRDERRAALFDRQLGALPAEQRRAIAIALSALELVEGDRKTSVRQALDLYWRPFLEGEP